MKEIISTLIKQHIKIKQDMDITLSLIDLDNKDTSAKSVHEAMNNFIADLQEHLKLENDVFYVELLDSMKTAKQDISKTGMFIEEMKGIEKSFLNFYKQFDTEEKIKNNLELFKEQFEQIKNILIIRIESEEAGVYGYWGLF